MARSKGKLNLEHRSSNAHKYSTSHVHNYAHFHKHKYMHTKKHTHEHALDHVELKQDSNYLALHKNKPYKLLLTPQGQCIPRLTFGDYNSCIPHCVCGRSRFCFAPRFQSALDYRKEKEKYSSHQQNKKDKNYHLDHMIGHFRPCNGRAKIDVKNITSDTCEPEFKFSINAICNLVDCNCCHYQAHNESSKANSENVSFLGQEQNSFAQSNIKNSPLPGFFNIDCLSNMVYIDPHVAYMLGIKWLGKGLSFEEFLMNFTWKNREIFHVFTKQAMSNHDTMTFKGSLTNGPMKGHTYDITLGALMRNQDGHLLYGMGYCSYSNTDFSSLVPREVSEDGTWVYDCVKNHLTVCDRYLSMIGYTRDDFPTDLNFWMKELVHPDDLEGFLQQKAQVFDSDQYSDNFEACFRLKHKDGSWVMILCRGIVLSRDVNSRAIKVTGTHTNLKQVKALTDNASSLSWKDNLTGLYNRRYLNAKKETYLSYDNQPLACLFADVTGLKLINDNLSHEMGNQLLIKVTRILSTAYNLPCDIFRLGGDEFLIMLPQTNQVHINMLVHNIEILSLVSQEKYQMPIFIGCGVATLQEVEGDFDKMIALADKRAQEKKSSQYKEQYTILYKYLSQVLGKNFDNVNNQDERRIAL